MHTKDFLANELQKIGLTDLSEKARSGYYHDFLSPLDTPELELLNDLALVGTPEAMALRQRAMAGEFDASSEESDEWAKSNEGRETFSELFGEIPVEAKFQIGQLVFKWTGDYTGPGRVRGIAELENGKLRYLVGHRLEGGTGELLHVYAEGNLRETNGEEDQHR
jgi:hypothetical protein